VYQFATMIGRGYRGEPAWNYGSAAAVASQGKECGRAGHAGGAAGVVVSAGL
jgi:hypothetical protein